MKKPPDPASFLLHSPLRRSQKPLSLSLEAVSGSMSSHHSGKGRVIVVRGWRRNVIVPDARFAYSRVRSGSRLHNCDLLGPVPEFLIYSTPIAIWESHLLPEHHARVSQSFLGVHLRPQPSTTVVIWLVPRGCVIRSSYSIYGMRWTWRLLGGSGCIQGLLRWLRSPIAAVGNRSVMDGQRNIITLPGVAVPLYLPLLLRVNCMLMSLFSSGYEAGVKLMNAFLIICRRTALHFAGYSKNFRLSSGRAGLLIAIFINYVGFMYFASRWLWLYDEMMSNEFHYSSFMPSFWGKNCLTNESFYCWLNLWFGWFACWVLAQGWHVPGCASQVSVAPPLGEQPWMSAPRCYPLRLFGSMRSWIISETWLTHFRISLFMYIWAYIFWTPLWPYFLMISGAPIIDSFPCWPKLNVKSVHTQAQVSILRLQSHSRPLCYESFGLTAQWELTTFAQSHFGVELLSPLTMIILVFTDQQIPNIYDLMSELRHSLKDLVGVKHDTWAVTGICTSHCLHEQRPTSPTAAYDRTLSTRSSLLIQGPVMLIFQFKMYCFPANVLARLHCTKFDIVLFTSSRVIHLDNCCNRCFISKFDQHRSVLGPCLMALELHLWMLGKVYFLGRAGIGLPGYFEIQ